MNASICGHGENHISGDGTLYIGIIVSIGSVLVQSFGLSVQKLGHLRFIFCCLCFVFNVAPETLQQPRLEHIHGD